MEHINIVVSEESEWKGNLGAKNPRVNSLEAGGQMQPKKSGAKKEPKPDRPDRLMATLEAVQSDIAVLKVIPLKKEYLKLSKTYSSS